MRLFTIVMEVVGQAAEQAGKEFILLIV